MELKEQLAHIICDYYDQLPPKATYLERKGSTRDFCDQEEVKTVVQQIVDAILADLEKSSI